ncbi:Mut7-C RNAse domain-containing protein [Halalkalicoccus tibetensis]|uniref:Mut7-C RNAse domain-containing protein n=1 Tax=Halalkalicoccus tibetensis TaxID=175632 RepID=A0ABD5V2B3_9EURY
MPTPDGTRLLLDAMLGKLATYLRMCGYDAAYALDRGVEADEALRTLAGEEGRLLLTRDTDLADRTADAVLLEARDVGTQLAELRDVGFELALDEPTRCSACNGELRELGNDEATPPSAPSTDERRVWRCRECGQPFWRGSHWDDVGARLEGLQRDRGETYRPD